jgi:hypothetical protein
MPDDKKEPQSYGSQADWVTGTTGETVNRLQGTPNSQHADFYESRRDSEGSGPHQGGDVSPVQAADNGEIPPLKSTGSERGTAGGNVAGAEGGAKREGFFKDRDYKRKP